MTVSTASSRAGMSVVSGTTYGIPAARILGHPGRPPLLDGRGKRFLHGLFGHVEVAQHANQRRDDAAPVGPVDLVDGGGGGFRGHATMVDTFPAGCRSGHPPFDSLVE